MKYNSKLFFKVLKKFNKITENKRRLVLFHIDIRYSAIVYQAMIFFQNFKYVRKICEKMGK